MSKKTDHKYLHIAIVLDQSGSMISVKDETINGFNEQVQTIKKTAENRDGKTTVSLVLFNDDVKFIVKMADPKVLKELTDKHYNPDYSTAMLDAIGATMLMFDKEVDDNENHRYLVIIISDGQENSSREFSYENIAKMINKRQNNGRWTFSYIGANQDLSQVAESMGIHKGNMMSYESTAIGSMTMFSSLSMSLNSFMSSPDASDNHFISKDNDPKKLSPFICNQILIFPGYLYLSQKIMFQCQTFRLPCVLKHEEVKNINNIERQTIMTEHKAGIIMLPGPSFPFFNIFILWGKLCDSSSKNKKVKKVRKIKSNLKNSTNR
jgi:uncharacterized protein YegL